MDFGLAPQHHQLQIGVREHGDQVAGLHQRTVFDEHSFDAPALDGIEENRASGHQAPAQGDEVFESADGDIGDGHALRVHAETASAQQRVDKPPGESQQQKGQRPEPGIAPGRGFPFHPPVHALAGNADACVDAAIGKLADFGHGVHLFRSSVTVIVMQKTCHLNEPQ